MMRRIPLWNPIFALALCIAFLPAASEAQVKGFSVLTLIENALTSPAAANSREALKSSSVDGATLVGKWSTLEPTRGNYDFKSVDVWLSLADSLHKQAVISIKAGSGTPAWLFDTANGVAAAHRLDFIISPHEGKTGQCDTESIAAPWDAVLLARWNALLAALSAHLKAKGIYATVAGLRLTGINRTSDELRLPAETAASTGLSCVSDADSTWNAAGYRPARLQQAWDTLTEIFRKNFPDKDFSVAIIPNPPQLAFPPLDASGSIIPAPVPDQNQGLLASAAQRFPKHLTVQFNFLMPGTPANASVIDAARSLGTFAAFQSNNYYSLVDSGAACGGSPAKPVPCNDSSYLSLLETGIFPAGRGDSLRARSLEIWGVNAVAFPKALAQAHAEWRASTAILRPDHKTAPRANAQDFPVDFRGRAVRLPCLRHVRAHNLCIAAGE